MTRDDIIRMAKEAAITELYAQRINSQYFQQTVARVRYGA